MRQALEYCGDNSTYSKRCLYLLGFLYMLNSFLTMGWPLYFDGNEFECRSEKGVFVPCDLKKACKFERLEENVRITGKQTLTREFYLICSSGRPG